MTPAASNRRSASRGKGEPALPQELSYSEAHTALELALAQLQSSDLAVEAMADLYQRARGYAERCEQVLQQIEHTVELWDPEQPDTAPTRFEP